jgi:hypothetical protein
MIAEADQLQRQLFTKQNADGGWGYQPGTSWTEPTALALLALKAHGSSGDAYNRGCAWLCKVQNRDGGWTPKLGIEASTSVTSIAVLALCQTGCDSLLSRGVDWLLDQVNPEPAPVVRLALRTLGLSPAKGPGGSPWFPGTAAWIAPSVMSVLALSRFAHSTSPAPSRYQRMRNAITQAQQYILSRKCVDGGWNHGGSSFRSENAESYPEMTGMALLALKGVSPAQLEPPLKRAEIFVSRSQSAEAASWLQMALMCHGRSPQLSSSVGPCRSLRDVCLRLLACAGPNVDNKLLMQSLPS